MCAIFGFTSPSLKKEQILPYFEKTKSRGPDDTRLEPAGSGMLGFHRLAIMGLHPEGMQPFHRGRRYGRVQRRAVRLPTGQKGSSRRMAMSLRPIPTAKLSFPCGRNTAPRCLPGLTRSSP